MRLLHKKRAYLRWKRVVDGGVYLAVLLFESKVPSHALLLASAAAVELKQHSMFMGFPLTHVHNFTTSSSMHCIGENFDADNSWKYRSCYFTHLCYDVPHRRFVLHPPATDAALAQAVRAVSNNNKNGDNGLVTLSTSIWVAHSNQAHVALSPLRRDASENEHNTLRWFPHVAAGGKPDEHGRYEGLQNHSSYYRLPDHVIWLPSTLSGDWTTLPDPDDRRAIRLLLASFRLDEYMRLHPDAQVLLGVPPEHEQLAGAMASSSLVCARQAVAGLGMIGNVWPASMMADVGAIGVEPNPR